MIVVCDSSILISLARINQLHLLYEVFGGVLISQGIYDEVVVRGAGRAGSEEVANADFIHVEQLQNSEDADEYVVPLSRVDAELIVLAKEQNASLLLSRDNRLRRRAYRERLNVASLMDFFILAKRNGVIPSVKHLLDEMRNKGILIREGIYQETLRRAGELSDE